MLGRLERSDAATWIQVIPVKLYSVTGVSPQWAEESGVLGNEMW